MVHDKGFNKVLNKARAEKIVEHLYGNKCLEVGCDEGQITKYLLNHFDIIDAIDINKNALGKIKSNEKLCKLNIPIEKFKNPGRKYDTIICTHVLEHVDNPLTTIKTLKKHSHDKTTLIFTVPNADSVNRLVGVDMGLIPSPNYLDKQDLAVGHKRMYNAQGFYKFLEKYFKIVDFGTMIYKPLPNSMMEKLPKSIVKKMFKMDVNSLGAEIYAVCRLK